MYISEIAQEFEAARRQGETWPDWRRRAIIAVYAAGTPDERLHCEAVIAAMPEGRSPLADDHGMDSA